MRSSTDSRCVVGNWEIWLSFPDCRSFSLNRFHRRARAHFSRPPGQVDGEASGFRAKARKLKYISCAFWEDCRQSGQNQIFGLLPVGRSTTRNLKSLRISSPALLESRLGDVASVEKHSWRNRRLSVLIPHRMGGRWRIPHRCLQHLRSEPRLAPV